MLRGRKPTTYPIQHPDGTATVQETNLLHLLRTTGLPNYQVGALAGIHHSVMSNYVQGKRDISIKHMKALCKVLGCSPEDILGWRVYHINADGEEVQPLDRYTKEG